MLRVVRDTENYFTVRGDGYTTMGGSVDIGESSCAAAATATPLNLCRV